MKDVMPFHGEMMTCDLCGRQQKSDPDVSSNWTTVDLDGRRFYVCPKHLPLNDRATKADFVKAWEHVLKSLMNRITRGKYD